MRSDLWPIRCAARTATLDTDAAVQQRPRAYGPARPWLTVVLDDYSRAVAGYALSLDAPSAIQTALALRQAIWRKGDAHWSVCGIRESFYDDHGSDFTSKHLERVVADLHMTVVYSTAGKPRGRGKIETLLRYSQPVVPLGSARLQSSGRRSRRAALLSKASPSISRGLFTTKWWACRG